MPADAAGDSGFTLLLGANLLLLIVVLVFMGAAGVLRLRNTRTEKRWDRLQGKWDAPIAEVLAGTRPAADLARSVGRGERLEFLDFLTRYARRIELPEREVIAELAHAHLPLVEARLAARSPEQRARAVWMIGLLDLPGRKEDVRKALDDESVMVAFVAARALVEGGDLEDAEAVLARLPRFRSWRTKYIASLLAAVGPAFAPSLRRIADDPDNLPESRMAALEALRLLHDFEAGRSAVRILERETNRDLRAGALRLIGQLADPRHLPMIRRVAKADDPMLRAQAIAALGQLGDSSDIPQLRQAVDDPSSWTVLHAATGLRNLGAVDLLHDLAISSHPRTIFARQALTER